MSQAPASADPTQDLAASQAWRALGLILLVALSLRVFLAATAIMIAPDSAVFITYARELGRDVLGALRGFDQHPLYPAMIALAHLAIQPFTPGASGWILAGRGAAIGASLVAVVAMYGLTARLYNRRVGLVAAAMLALLPDACHYGADVLSDLPHLALYLLALWALVAGLQTAAAWRLTLGAALSGLAFLARPEGGGPFVVGIVAVALADPRPWKRRLVVLSVMTAAFLALVGPYQGAVGKLVPKKSLLELFQLGEEHSRGRPAAAELNASSTAAPSPLSQSRPALAAELSAPAEAARQWLRACRVVYALLAVFGLWVARPRRRGVSVVFAAFALQAALLHALKWSHGYMDRRHALVLAALSLPLAAAGLWWLARRIRSRVSRGARRPGTDTEEGAAYGPQAPSPATRIAAVLVAGCALLTSPWLLRPLGPGEDHVRDASRWLAAHTQADAVVVGDRRLHRVALCADRAFVEWGWWQGRTRDLAKSLPAGQTRLFVVDTRHMSAINPRFLHELRATFGDRMKLLASFEAPPVTPKTEIRVYRYDGGA